VAVSAGPGAIRPDSDKALTFSGQPSVSIPPGAPMFSDPLAFNLAAQSDLAITIHIATAPDAVTTHPGSRATSYLQSGDAVSAADLSSATKVEHWYFLDDVDVQSSAAAGAVVTFGDSITDGAHSTENANTRWPDDLARRLAANKKTAGIGVLNEGIGGNRLLHDMTGPNALARFDRDVLSQSGVRWLIILEGINDLGAHGRTPLRDEKIPTAQELIAAYQQMILRAHTHRIRVFGATILPYQGAGYFSSVGEADRQTINQWIRTSGAFDAVIDLDAATRDPQKPTQLAPTADSGDHLHPGDVGYKAMADAIDLKLFLK
jgi:lysophospholipase L1-like esterase